MFLSEKYSNKLRWEDTFRGIDCGDTFTDEYNFQAHRLLNMYSFLYVNYTSAKEFTPPHRLFSLSVLSEIHICLSMYMTVCVCIYVYIVISVRKLVYPVESHTEIVS